MGWLSWMSSASPRRPDEVNADPIALATKDVRKVIQKLHNKLPRSLVLEMVDADVQLQASPAVMPQGEDSPYTTIEGLLESVRSGAIRPLRGTFLIALQKRGGRLVRRQDLPEEAFFTANELVAVANKLGKYWRWLFVALSYRWLSASHPDPDGFHLEIVARVAAKYIQYVAAIFKARGDLPPDFALFWDFGSLTQKPRTAAEEALFLPGLKASNIWYGHMFSTCWMQTTLPKGFKFEPFLDNKTGKMKTPAQTYKDSGWCFIEAIISAGIKTSIFRLDFALITETAMRQDYDNVAEACAARRPVPILPDEAARLLRDEKTFTAGSDVEIVAKLYRSFFEGVTQSTVKLSFSMLHWGDAGVRQLAVVLPSFAKLENLSVSSNIITDAGAATLAETCQHLPQLRVLDLSNNHIEDAGVAALVAVISKEGAFPSLTNINLSGNYASDKAKRVVQEAIARKRKEHADTFSLQGFWEANVRALQA